MLSYLDRVYPGLGAPYAFYRSDSSPMQRTDGDQAGSDREMTSKFMWWSKKKRIHRNNSSFGKQKDLQDYNYFDMKIIECM